MLIRQLRLSARNILRAPGFTLGVIVTLALGVAASTFIFAVVYGVLLRPLPFAGESRLVMLANTIPAASVGGFPFSMLEYVEHRDLNRAFSGVAAFAQANVTMMNGQTPERVPAARVTANFFDVLGAPALIGRTFEAADGAAGAECVVVLRHGYWRSRFGGTPDAIGQPIQIDDRPCRIVGVGETEFRWPATADIWLPQPVPAEPPPTALGRQSYRPIARLREGIDREQATRDTRALAERFYARYPDFYDGSPWQITVTPIREQVLGNVSTMLVALAGAVVLVFAIACGNVTQLMLSRMLARDREFSIRLSLGARRWQVLSQLGVECALLGGIGGALGLWQASSGLTLFVAAQSIDLPRRESIALDGAAMMFALVATSIGVIAMATPAAVRLFALPSRHVLAQGRFGPSAAARRWREGLVVIQVALTMMLVVGAALLLISLQRLINVAPGFDVRGRVVAQVSPPPSRYPDLTRSAALFTEIVDRLSALPGVAAAGAVSALPLSGQDPRAAFTIENWTPEQAARATEVHYRYVAGDYFRAIGMRLASGRWPGATDGRDAPRIAIVNEAFARRFWSATVSALGHRVSIDGGATWHAIIGVSVDVKHMGLDAAEQIELFIPYEQATGPLAASMALVMQTALPPASMAASARDAIAVVDPRLPVHAVRTMEDVVAASVSRPQLRVFVTGLFAAIGLLLAGVGTFCVLAQFVGERTYEIAVRRALGAQAGSIAWLVIRRGLLMLGAGAVAGIAGGAALSGSISALLFGVDATQPVIYFAAAAVVATAAFAACLIPLRRAVRVSPLLHLRAE